MAETLRTIPALLTVLADNSAGDISAEDVRDIVQTLRRGTRSISASGTLLETDMVVLADAAGGAIVATLPTVGLGKMSFTVKKIDASANTVTLDGSGSETIDGGLTAVLTTQYEALTVACDGAEWWII